MRYRLVLFDFDGTLADSFPWVIGVVNDLADELRFRRIEPGDLDRLRSLGARQLIREMKVSWWKLPLVARRMRQRMSAVTDRIPLFPGVPDMLHALHAAGVGLGVVTSNAERNARAVLRDSAAVIQHWQCETSLFGKAARMRAVLRQTGVPADQALCVGDELRDADAARAAGVPFAGVAWGYTNRDALAAGGCTVVFDRVEDIMAQVLGKQTEHG